MDYTSTHKEYQTKVTDCEIEQLPVFISWSQVCMSFSHCWPDSYCMYVVLNCFTHSTNLLVCVAPVNKPISCQRINAKNLVVARYCICITSLLWKHAHNKLKWSWEEIRKFLAKNYRRGKIKLVYLIISMLYKCFPFRKKEDQEMSVILFF